ncbi:MAG: ankyrin repeat domain-containing protein [Nitrospinota bacterium]|nr:ankyrin repeat domain-containing protein [Nitrospinota bacterium]
MFLIAADVKELLNNKRRRVHIMSCLLKSNLVLFVNLRTLAYLLVICLIYQAAAMPSISWSQEAGMHDRKNDLGEQLVEAANKGQEGRVKELVAKGADPNYISDTGITPLAEASGWGHNDIVKYLIAQGADVNLRAKNNMTALMAASMLGRTEVMKTLISNGANIDAIGDTGWTALRLACAMRFIQAVDLLLHSGVSIEASGKEGTLDLYFLAFAGKSNHVKELISRGAAINEIAIMEDHNLGSPLYGAVENGNLETALVLIENGAAVNMTATNGWTPLMMAATNNDLQMTKTLLENGADVKLKNVDNNTALMLVVREKGSNMDVIKLLEEAEKLAK